MLALYRTSKRIEDKVGPVLDKAGPAIQKVGPVIEEMQIVVGQEGELRRRDCRRLPRGRLAGARATDLFLLLAGDLAPPGRTFRAAFASRTGAERF